jgi:hypothetical protein
MPALSAPTQGLVEQWLQLDQEEGSRRIIQSLVQADNEEALTDMLGKRLAFGMYIYCY